MLLFGSDTYRRGIRMRTLLAAFSKKHPAGLVDRFDISVDGEFERLTAFCHNESLFATAKLGVVTNVSEAEKPGITLLKTIIEHDATTLILLADKKPTKDYAFLFKKPAVAEEYAPPEGAALMQFIETEAKVRGAKLTVTDVRSLASAFSGDTWALVTELDKMAMGGATQQTARTPAFFPLIQTLKGRGAISQKLVALAYLLENEDPAAVFNITASMSDGEQKTAMADYDLAIKSGKLDFAEALTDFALRG